MDLEKSEQMENFKPFQNFTSFNQMLQWEGDLTPDERKYLQNIIKIEASKMQPPFCMILNAKFKTERFDFLLLCLEYIYTACNKLNEISYNDLTTELKRF